MNSSWEKIGSFAPHTKSVFEFAQAQDIDIVSRINIPDCLNLPTINPQSENWQRNLDDGNQLNPSITNREVILRYLLAKAIVDQGSDTPGIQMWFEIVVNESYKRGIQFIHDPTHFVERYSEILSIAHLAGLDVTEERAEKWADAQPNRKAGVYTPFNVDGQRGGKYTHWFTSSRLFPALLASYSIDGGLTQIVFGEGPLDERPLDMARKRLRNDHKYGLGYCIGDKAADLFVKWSIGCLNLTPPEMRDWQPTETVIPMDQRIGRVMMRCGFMEEFFDTELHVRKYLDGAGEPMFANNEGVALPETGLPDGELFLWVRQFRRRGRTSHRGSEKTRSDAHGWCRDAWKENYEAKIPVMDPQTVVQVLCKAITEHNGKLFSSAHLDDFFFDLAEDYCHDKNPKCNQCTVSSLCLANNIEDMHVLKKYIT